MTPTLMTPALWRDHIMQVVRHIADRDYQETAWFGRSRTHISSPEELYCQLFDDYDFDQFLHKHGDSLTSTQLAAAVALKDKMEAYPLPMEPDPHSVIDDPGWESIRKAAKNFLAALETHPREQP